MNKFEIYFNDLTKEAQERLKKTKYIGNIDLKPITIINLNKRKIRSCWSKTYTNLKSDLKVKIIEPDETLDYQSLVFYDLIFQRTKRNELKIVKTRYIIIN